MTLQEALAACRMVAGLSEALRREPGEHAHTARHHLLSALKCLALHADSKRPVFEPGQDPDEQCHEHGCAKHRCLDDHLPFK